MIEAVLAWVVCAVVGLVLLQRAASRAVASDAAASAVAAVDRTPGPAVAVVAKGERGTCPDCDDAHARPGDCTDCRRPA